MLNLGQHRRVGARRDRGNFVNWLEFNFNIHRTLMVHMKEWVFATEVPKTVLAGNSTMLKETQNQNFSLA